MDAGPLDVLEQARDEHVGPVGHGVDVDLDPLEVAIDPDRSVGIDDGRHGQLADEVAGAVAEVDGQPADDERRPDDDRVADPLGQGQRLLDAMGHAALRLRDAEPVEERREPGPLLGQVDGLEIGPEERDPGGGQRSGEVERGLAAELDEGGKRSSVRAGLGLDHAQHATRGRAARSTAGSSHRSRSTRSPGSS